MLPYGALWANIPWPSEGAFIGNALEQRYRRASHMAGILPIGKQDAHGPPLAAFFWSLRRNELERWRSRPLAEWKQEVEQLWPEAASAVHGIVDHGQLVFAQYDHFTLRAPYSNGLVHIGDAARRRVRSSDKAPTWRCWMRTRWPARCSRTSHWQNNCAVRRMRYWHMRIFQAASKVFTPFYQSDSRLLPMFVTGWQPRYRGCRCSTPC